MHEQEVATLSRCLRAAATYFMDCLALTIRPSYTCAVQVIRNEEGMPATAVPDHSFRWADKSIDYLPVVTPCADVDGACCQHKHLKASSQPGVLWGAECQCASSVHVLWYPAVRSSCQSLICLHSGCCITASSKKPCLLCAMVTKTSFLSTLADQDPACPCRTSSKAISLLHVQADHC